MMMELSTGWDAGGIAFFSCMGTLLLIIFFLCIALGGPNK